MIKTSIDDIKTPQISELFHLTDEHRGICLFSSSTDSDTEYTGLNPVIILKESYLQVGTDRHSINDPLKELDAILERYRDLPEEISLLGYISYDFKDRLEEEGLYEKKQQSIYPEFYFVLFEHYIISSRDSDSAQLYSLNFPFEFDSVSLELTAERVPVYDLKGQTGYKGTSLNRKAYMDAVSRTVEYIRAGDIYQANITRAIYGKTDMTPVQTALNLYASNRISFGVFASVPGGHITSTSPELFFKTECGYITASPIKGTIQRGKTEKEDLGNKEELLQSEKNIAELAMIVDLLRNDLSQVCLPGTVNVPRFPILMILENVYHLYADITGELIPGTGIGRILKKTFPGGSITGCPKIRACQIIDELESTARGVYTGSFGRISFNGKSQFNIMIRSLFQSGRDIIFNVGGGITLLSDPAEEFDETIHKGRNIWKAINMERVEEEQYYTGD